MKNRNTIVKVLILVLFVLLSFSAASAKDKNALVLQTDFGLKDGAVAAMYGVAFNVDNNLRIFNLTHEIPAYNIWEAGYRLMQTIAYWPQGTVFVSVVDPGVGTERKSVVVKTKTGHYIVTPDNGTLTFIADKYGIDEVREIDETKNRLPGSQESYTFYGRDVYVYTGARLAAGKIVFADVGKILGDKVEKIAYQKAKVEGHIVWGNIPILDIQYGNVWTNINKELLSSVGIKPGDILQVTVYRDKQVIYTGDLPLVHTFGDVPDKAPLAYYNSLMDLSFALNMDNFSVNNKVYSGAEWDVKIEKR